MCDRIPQEKFTMKNKKETLRRDIHGRCYYKAIIVGGGAGTIWSYLYPPS